MDAFEIQGPCSLDGEIQISGSKNATLPILFSSLMCTRPVTLLGVPDVVDIHTTRKLFQALGIPWVWDGDQLSFDPRALTSCEAPYDLVKRMRASVLCLGPLLTRLGEAKVSFPGGCAIGARPINLHLDAFKQMGAEIDMSQGYVHAKAKRLQGTTITFPKVTVTGTENVICAAVLAQGVTTLHHAACEPEIKDLCDFLKACGARISGEGTETIHVEGVRELTGSTYAVMKDRIEYGTYALAAAATKSRLVLKGNFPALFDPVLAPLRSAGVSLTYDEVAGETVVDARKTTLESVSITTAPFPGFATDLQAQWMALMTQAQSPSVIAEHVFESRFNHAAELCRLGAKIELRDATTAVVTPTPGRLTGADVMATDLRASASLVIAGLMAQGTTRIRRIYHLDRGYESMEKKLAAVGATIRRIPLPM